jgi:hypothetical protein
VVSIGVSCSTCFRSRVELVAHALPGHVLTISAALTRCACDNNSNQHDTIRCGVVLYQLDVVEVG